MSVLAQSDEQSVRIYPSGNTGPSRTEFQRDRERVVNCKAFRRLVDKAQIFGSEKGDYYRTRMTHSLEVNQIAKAIAYALRLNLDLTEAIALGHDLGHTPFGHQGERTLDEILGGKIDVGINATEAMFAKRCYGGFKHNYQSARVLTEIEEKYKEFPGLNVSVQVIEGVLKHTKLKPNEINIKDFISEQYLSKIHIDYKKEMQVCSSLEGQVVAVADEIAQRGHDVDDALTSGVMTIEEFEDRLKINKCSELYKKIFDELKKVDDSERLIVDARELKIATIVSKIVNYFIEATIKCSLNQIEEHEKLGKITLDNQICMVGFSNEVKKVNDYLEKVVQKKVICNSEVARADHNASMIVQRLFERYYKNPRLLHSGTIHKIFIETLKHKNKAVSNSAINLSDGSIKLVNEEIKEITTTDLDEDKIIKHINNVDNSCTDKDIIIFEKRRILIRAITDYIAGMTDGYALEEYERLK
ncbi:MAG: dNTP triphosphohydrolase [Lachnospiraceae bacterium]|nr:dNTP triphosphohydrolase [Lachnospiraceae bacterium]